MKKLCAWCQKFLSGDENALIVSHGICPECVAKYFPEDKETICAK